MGVLLLRQSILDSTPTPQSKQKMFAIMARAFDILSGGAKESIYIKITSPIKVSIRQPGGRIDEVELVKPDALMKEYLDKLMRAESFEAMAEMEDIDVVFRYDEKEHYGRGIEVRIKAPFRESMDKYAAGFVLVKDVITSAMIYKKVQSRAKRIQQVISSVAKKFLGDSYTEDTRELRSHQFRRDRVYINIFGFIFTIRTRWED